MVTGDAQYCQTDVSATVVAARGGYFWMVKENQPTLLEAIATLFRMPPPGERIAQVVSRSRHGDRQETRTLRCSTALNAYLSWPHLAQVCQIERVVTQQGRTRQETAYAITSAPPQRAGPRRLLRWWRGHWQIEDRLHWVRDVTFDEDRAQIRTGAAPQGIAAVRNTAIGVLRRAGVANIAAGLRHLAARPAEILSRLGLTPPPRL